MQAVAVAVGLTERRDRAVLAAVVTVAVKMLLEARELLIPAAVGVVAVSTIPALMVLQAAQAAPASSSSNTPSPSNLS
jgi:hypothetical protein